VKVAVDTNVLVRYLTWDDESQAAEAAAAIEGADGVVIPTIVLCELVWVLRRAYRYPARQVIDVLRRLMASRHVEVDRPSAEAGLSMLARGGDFAAGVVHFDARRAKCAKVVTFDQTFAEALGPDDALLLGAP
jgi:predicted nucleic-acid-binding protein